MGNEGIVVGVFSPCYNHAKFLKNYMEGIIGQKTSFSFKVYIYDDASTDGSQDILREYEVRYPNLFHIVYAKENQYSKGIKPKDIMWPKMRHCRYVAFCECDDEWIYPYKLQTQFDFMEEHPETMLFFHNALNWYHDGSNKKENIINGLETSFLGDENCIIFRNGHFPTCSMMVRTERLLDFPDYARRAPVGDDPLTYWCAANGRIYYLDKVWAIRNYIHEESWNYRFRNDKAIRLKYLFGFMRFLHEHDIYTNGRYSKYISEISSCLVDSSINLLIEGKNNDVNGLKVAVEQCEKESCGAIDAEYEFLKRVDMCEGYMAYVLDYLRSFNGAIFIYGAGKRALEVKETLDQAHVEFQGFVVSALDNAPAKLLGYDIFEYLDVVVDKNIVFVLGLNRRNRMAVLDFLKKNCCKAKVL